MVHSILRKKDDRMTEEEIKKALNSYVLLERVWRYQDKKGKEVIITVELYTEDKVNLCRSCDHVACHGQVSHKYKTPEMKVLIPEGYVVTDCPIYEESNITIVLEDEL